MELREVIRTNEVRRIVGNAQTGTAMSLHSGPEMRDFRKLVIGGGWIAATTWKPSMLSNRVKMLRFGGLDGDGRISISSAPIPLYADSRLGYEALADDVCTVVTLPILYSQISASDKGKKGFSDVPAVDWGSKELELAACAKAFSAIPKRARVFHLSGSRVMGNPILWFISKRIRIDLDAAFSANRRSFKASKADWYCAYLGLGHRPKGTWLALLTLPAQVVQHVGHYRPVFCDGADFPWFAVGCSSRAHRTTAPWGQTANLKALADTSKVVAGAPERVSRQIFYKDFTATSMAKRPSVRFDILGKTTRDWGSPLAEQELTDEIWRNRGF